MNEPRWGVIIYHNCEYCDASYSQKGNLKTHVNMVHLDIRKYVCKDCKYASYSRSDLKRHRDSVHKNS